MASEQEASPRRCMEVELVAVYPFAFLSTWMSLLTLSVSIVCVLVQAAHALDIEPASEAQSASMRPYLTT